MPERNVLTIAQDDLVKELIETYGLEAEQIGFEGDDANPILDYEALCVMRINLTDFQDVQISEPVINIEQKSVSVKCTITLRDSRTVNVSEDVALGDPKPDGKLIETIREAKVFARARAMRFAIRTAGVNLMRAHRDFMKTGKVATASPVDPRTPIYQEVHLLAAKLGFIQGKDKSAYEGYIAEMFEGRTSSKDLNDIELQKLLVSFRSFARLKRSEITAEQAA